MKRPFSNVLRFASAAVLLCALTLTGCGGNSAGPVNQTLYPLASATRALKIGDTWTYKSHSVSNSIVSGPQTVDNIYVVSINTATYNNETVLARVNGDTGSTDYLRQDAQGSLTVIGENGNFCLDKQACSIGDPQPALFGQWHTGDKFTYQWKDPAVPNPAPGISATVEVIGMETVTIPLGRFATWKVQVTYSRDALYYNGGFAETYWYAPQLGTYVKRVSTGSVTADMEISGQQTDTLTATSVPLS